MGSDGECRKPSVRARALSLALRLWVRPIVQAWSRAPGLPWPYWTVDQVGRLNRLAPATRVIPIDLPRCRAQWIDARTSYGSSRVILYLPGGGFLVGGWHLHRGFLSRLSRRTDAQILAVDYRKLPYNPFTSAADDALDGYRHLLDQGIAPDDIVVAGDSAGGFLALQVADRVRQAGLPQPSAIVAISPLLSLVDLKPNGRGCAVLTPRAIAALARFSNVDAADETGRICLAHPDLPPVLIHAAAGETLAGQIRDYEKLLIKFGVPHEVRFWPLDVHVFHTTHWLPEAAEAVDSIAQFLDRIALAPVKASAA
ncbi:MAG: alpha/beta hydrolase [Aeromicrobium sp.]